MIKQIGTLVVLFSGWFCFGQNLIPDGSFEDKIQCPDNQGQLNYLRNWFKPNWGSSDLFCPCFTSDTTALEHKTAQKDSCFIGLVLSGGNTSGPDAREYGGIRLNQNLLKGTKYCLKLWTVSSSKTNFVISNIQFGFDSDSISVNTGDVIEIDTFFNLTQSVLKDSSDWVLLEKEIVATGNEQFLYIGNFDSSEATIIHDYNAITSPPFLYNFAYYFFDNVSLTKCLPPIEESSFSLYPNPSNGQIYTEFDADTSGVFYLYNSVGQLVNLKQINPGNFQGILFEHLASGSYIVNFVSDAGWRREQKLIVIE